MIVEYWEKGKLKRREATNEEAIGHTTWHEDKPIRVIFRDYVLKKIIIKKEFNDYAKTLYNYFTSNKLTRVEVGDDLFIYLEELYPEHEAIIREFGGEVESKTI